MNIKKNNPHVSVVIPVYGSPESIGELYDRLVTSLSEITNKFEIIMVNDASPDDSWGIIKSIAQKDERVRGINLSRNFGQHRAIHAGLDHAQGDWVVVMDCDLQDQPEEIVKLYDKAKLGYEVVFGSRVERQDGFFKKNFSRLFYKLLSYLTNTEQDAAIANFGIYKKCTIDAVLSMGDEIKYFPVMIRWIGFHSSSVEIEHAERKVGKSSYSYSTLIDLAVDIILSFSNKPLKIAVKLGFFISILSFVISICVLLNYFFNNITVPGWASTVMSLWFLGGLIIMVLGIVGIYVGKTFDQTKNRPSYLIKETT